MFYKPSSTIIDTDSYKLSHHDQYPKGTSKVYSYIESRGGDFDKVLFFGLQPILKTLELGIDKNDIKYLRKFKDHGVPLKVILLWENLLKKYKGKLPVLIKAVPEGKLYPTGVPLITIENTDPKFAWVTSYVETMLLRVWYPITVATLSYHIKKIIYKYLEMTSDNPDEEILFKLHDFGSRGVSSAESAKIGTPAHLVNFRGSDTLIGIAYANDLYYCDMAGFSIPAMEHSTVTAWGKEREIDAYSNFMDRYKDSPLIAMVTDSYDQTHALDHIFGVVLKDKIIERSDKGYSTTLRLDSGDPKETVLEALEILAERFGTTLNTKGYKVLNHNVRVLQGDGVNLQSIEEILEIITSNGFSATNVTFGMGGALLQGVNRDTSRFAMKASYVESFDGESRDICKNPIGDPTKRSKAGRLDRPDLVQVFLDGKILKEYTMEEVRENTTF
jgi:nicotinamide phosphoribosyltransferase